MASEKPHLDASLRKIAKGAGIAFTGSFAGMFLGYFSRMIIGRWLGPADYGLISLGFAAMSIGAVLASIGLTSGIQRYVSFYKGKEDPGRIKGTILSALKISLPLSIIVALFFFFQADWICLHIFHEARLIPVLRIFSIGIPFWVLATNLTSVSIGFQQLRYRVYVTDLFQNIFKLIAIVALLVLGQGVTGAAWGWTLAIIGMPFLAFYLVEKNVFPILHSRIKAINIDRELFSYSWPLIFTSVAGLMIAWTDTLMLGYFSSAFAVGIYNAALPLAQALRSIHGAFIVIFMPVATELYARKGMKELKASYSTVTRWILSLTLPAFLLMALFSHSVLWVLFGPEFTSGATALSILALGFLAPALLSLSRSMLQVYGKTRFLMLYSFTTAGLNVILNYLLIPVYGINGAAIATATSLTTGSIITWLLALRITGMQPFKKSFIKPVAASLLSVSIVYALTRYIIGVSIPSLVGMLLVFLALYFFLLLLFKSFGPEDLVIMSAIDQKTGMHLTWLRNIIRRFL
ncbi:MAG: flippase [Dehalococcoidia bacterium]|nr:flippase [Dehalococcoidia bacterium]